MPARTCFRSSVGKWLAGQRQHSRFVTQLHDVAVGFDNLVGVARSQSHQAGNCPQRSQMLYRLMSRTVFAVAHGVVCENKMVGSSIKADSRIAGRA